MPDYQKMYTTLFNAVTNAICELQKSQQTTEEMFISSEEPIITILPPVDGSENKDSGQI